MIVVLLVTSSGTALSGWLMAEFGPLAMLTDMPQIETPAFTDDDREETGEGDDLPKEVHEMLASLMLVLIVLHVGGVVLASRRDHENPARAMVTGRKLMAGPGDVA